MRCNYRMCIENEGGYCSCPSYVTISESGYCETERRKSDDKPTTNLEVARWKYFRKQGIAVCTACSFERKLDDNFGRAMACPNCGAKMDGAE